MTNKKIFYRFTAYKHFESSEPLDDLKTFCEDNGLQFSDVEIERELHECKLCGDFIPLDEIHTDNTCRKCQEQEDCSHNSLDAFGDCSLCGKTMVQD